MSDDAGAEHIEFLNYNNGFWALTFSNSKLQQCILKLQQWSRGFKISGLGAYQTKIIYSAPASY